MARGSTYTSERAIAYDARSGLRIFRLTHFPSISTNLYFEMGSFTEDERFVVFNAQRYAGRDAPWDLFRASTDGLELVQLTECDDISGIVVSPANGCVLYQSKSELRRVDIVSLKEECFAALPGITAVSPGSLATIDSKGAAYFGSGVRADGKGIVFRVSVETGRVDTLFEGGRQNHLHVDPSARTLYFGDLHEGGATCYLCDADGSNRREYPFRQFAHMTWFGDTGKMQGCLLPPGHAIVTYAEGDKEPEIVTQGRYYWHSSASRDAQWIIADTNWPREGLYLVHAPTRTVTYVCNPGASCSHPQWTHPHPALSPKMKYVLFNSDLTGVGQVYLAELTAEFLSQAASGYACKSGTEF